MRYPLTDEEKAYVARLRAARSTPSGHAPMSSFTIPAEYYIYNDGDPRLVAAFEKYDRDYFTAHPEDREKYGYKGP